MLIPEIKRIGNREVIDSLIQKLNQVTIFKLKDKQTPIDLELNCPKLKTERWSNIYDYLMLHFNEELPVLITNNLNGHFLVSFVIKRDANLGLFLKDLPYYSQTNYENKTAVVTLTTQMNKNSRVSGYIINHSRHRHKLDQLIAETKATWST